MSVDPAEILVEECYVTSEGRVRQVLEVTEIDVTYQSRWNRPRPLPWGPKLTAGKDKFAADVLKRVSTDYNSQRDPDFRSISSAA